MSNNNVVKRAKGRVSPIEVLTVKDSTVYLDAAKAFQHAVERPRKNGSGSMAVTISPDDIETPDGIVYSVRGSVRESGVSEREQEKLNEKAKQTRTSQIQNEMKQATANGDFDKASALIAELKALESQQVVFTGTSQVASAVPFSLADGYKNVGKEAKSNPFFINGLQVIAYLTIDGASLSDSPARKAKSEARKTLKAKEANNRQVAKQQSDEVKTMFHGLQLQIELDKLRAELTKKK